MDIHEAAEQLLPRGQDLAARLVPGAEWAYARVGPTSCEMKGDPNSYQFAHRFALSAESAPGKALPQRDELFELASGWLTEQGFELAAPTEDQPEDVLFLTASGEPGRVTVAAGPEAILLSVATHPMPGGDHRVSGMAGEN